MATRRSRTTARRGGDGTRPPASEGERSRAQIRAEARQRKAELEARQRRKMLAFYIGTAVVLAVATAILGDGGGSFANFLPDGPGLPTSLLEDPNAERISALTARDIRVMNSQREAVDRLARRYVGKTPTGNLDDIRIVQEIMNAEVLTKDDVWELQALGVVIGDVMVRNLGLEWVAVNDDYGRSRALRKGTGSDLVFPVTLISKRVEQDITIYVDQLYDKLAVALGFPETFAGAPKRSDLDRLARLRAKAAGVPRRPQSRTPLAD